jgi:hypothetical protein
VRIIVDGEFPTVGSSNICFLQPVPLSYGKLPHGVSFSSGESLLLGASLSSSQML